MGPRSAAAILSASLASCTSVHTETVIPATPAEVWAVLVDPSGYDEWNPVFVRAEGAMREGETVTYRVREPNGEEYTLKATVAAIVDRRELNQYGGTWGVLTFEHTWQLEPVEGGTRVIQNEEYRGVGVWFWDESWIEPAYARANDALRKRVLQKIERSRKADKRGRD